MENIVNSGFETGDFTGWTNTGGFVQTAQHHSGSYSALIYSAIETQAVSFNILPSKITAFGFWLMNNSNTDGTYRIVFTDATYDQHALPNYGDNNWHYVDLTGFLGGYTKNIANIWIHGGASNPHWIDDVTLQTSGGGSPTGASYSAGMSVKAIMFFWLMSGLKALGHPP